MNIKLNMPAPLSPIIGLKDVVVVVRQPRSQSQYLCMYFSLIITNAHGVYIYCFTIDSRQSQSWSLTD